MRLPDFELEVFFSRYEFSTPYLLAQSDCESLSIDDLLALEPDPEKARHDFLQTRLGYSPNDGNPALRRAVSGLYRHMAERDVLLFTGAQEGIFACMNVLLEPGDHVICQFPGYQSLYDLPRALGCTVDFWQLEAEGQEGGWRLDLEALKKLIRPETRLVVVNSPHNPTGFVLDARQTQELCALARQHGIWIFADEVYRGLGRNARPGEEDRGCEEIAPWLCDVYERGISLGVMSKAYGLPGVRVGWLACGDAGLMDGISRYKNYLSICGATPSESLACTALAHGPELLRRSRNIIQENLRVADAFFARYAAFFTYNRPQAGPIGFPLLHLIESSEEFCIRLAREAGVLLLPGSVYGLAAPYVRMGFGRKSFAANLAVLDGWLQRQKTV
ncbi:aminotransferase class I/II-fold pyridoxal phosphate-dependent enzyme [Desulfovibrio sp. 1188_IL3213]|uniref:aminotransferase class I/II-fold pyridoxal phosphate-dependent enzyme n=1 Tax=Desulfovibrio sp. 1188_IL3213 TaxID=3084052 RepID=UPI002FD921E4